jgi:hypothetical protein
VAIACLSCIKDNGENENINAQEKSELEKQNNKMRIQLLGVGWLLLGDIVGVAE